MDIMLEIINEATDIIIQEIGLDSVDRAIIQSQVQQIIVETGFVDASEIAQDYMDKVH
jgi:hypothetical protein